MAQSTEAEVQIMRDADVALRKAAIQYQEIARWAHMLMAHCHSRGFTASTIELQLTGAKWAMIATSYLEMIALNKEDLDNV